MIVFKGSRRKDYSANIEKEHEPRHQKRITMKLTFITSEKPG